MSAIVSGTPITPGNDGWLASYPIESIEADAIWTHGVRAELLTITGEITDAVYRVDDYGTHTIAGWWRDNGRPVGISQIKAWRPCRAS